MVFAVPGGSSWLPSSTPDSVRTAWNSAVILFCSWSGSPRITASAPLKRTWIRYFIGVPQVEGGLPPRGGGVGGPARREHGLVERRVDSVRIDRQLQRAEAHAGVDGHTDEQRHQHGYVDLRLRRFDVPGFVVVERVNFGGAGCLQPARRGRTEAQDCPAGPRGGGGGERG